MLEIAGGIILAVLFFVFLPAILLLGVAAVALTVGVTLVVALVWLTWAVFDGDQTAIDVALLGVVVLGLLGLKVALDWRDARTLARKKASRHEG